MSLLPVKDVLARMGMNDVEQNSDAHLVRLINETLKLLRSACMFSE